MTTELARTQRRMQALITDPHDSDPQAGGDLVCETTALGAADRVALYRRAYHLRLVSCLREIHPALRHALTPELFDAFALEYLAERPSRSYTLTTLAAGWPEHLQATRPDRGAQASRRERWPDFLVDLARLERTFHEVYDAPGAEDLKLPCADDLPAAPDGGWLAATVEPVACLRLARARYPVGAYMLAVRRGEDPPLPAPAPTHVAVSRRDYVVTLTELDAAGYALLRELTGGASVAAAAGGAGLPAAAAWALLRGWADRGFFSAIVVPQAVVQTTRGKIR